MSSSHGKTVAPALCIHQLPVDHGIKNRGKRLEARGSAGLLWERLSPRNGGHEPQNSFPHVACSGLSLSPLWREDSCLSSAAHASPPDLLLSPHVIHLYPDLFSPWVLCCKAGFSLRKCSTFFSAVSPQGSSLVYSVIFKNFFVWPSLPSWHPLMLFPHLLSKPCTASGFWVHSRYPGQPPSLCLWWFKDWNQLSAQTPGKAKCL